MTLFQTVRDKIKFDMIKDHEPDSFAGKVYNKIFNSIK